MEKDILAKIIEVEKGIQERLESEKIKASEWVEKVRKESETEISREEEKANESCKKNIDEAVADAESKAYEILKDASALAEKLGTISDEQLEKVVLKHIASILPEGRIVREKTEDPAGETL